MFNKKDPTDRGSDFDFDDDFDSDLDGFGGDFDDYDSGLEDGEVGEKSRKPVTKALKNVKQSIRKTGRAAVIGAGQGIADKIEKIMPEVGQAYKGAVDVATEANLLRNDIRQKAMPVINETKRTARRLAQQLEGQIPFGIDKKILKLLGEEERVDQIKSAEEARDEHIGQTLGEIFKLQTKKSMETQRRDEVNRFMDRRIDQAHHTELARLLSTTQAQTVYQTAFLRGPFTAYLKKDLELKYKHFYTAQDTLGILKNTSEMLSAELEAIKQNTALPDMQKVRATEMIGHDLKTKFTQSFSNKIGNYFGQMRQNIMDQWVNPAIDAVTDINGMLDSIADMIEMENEMGGSGGDSMIKEYTTKGGLFRQFVRILSKSAAGKLVVKIIDKADPKVRTALCAYLRRGKKGLALLVNDVKNGKFDLGDKLGGIGEGIQSLIESIAPDLKSVDTLANVSYQNLREVSPITRQFTDTVEKIIPGYLSMQTRYLEMMATGNQNAEQLHYNWKTQKFTRSSAYKSQLLEELHGDEVTRAARQKTDARTLSDIVNSSTANDRDAGARKRLANADLETNIKNINTVLENIAHSDRYLNDIYGVVDRCYSLLGDPKDIDRDSTFYKDVFYGLTPEEAQSVAQFFVGMAKTPRGMTDHVFLSRIASEVMHRRDRDDDSWQSKLWGMSERGDFSLIEDELGGSRDSTGDYNINYRHIASQSYKTALGNSEIWDNPLTKEEQKAYDRISAALRDAKDPTAFDKAVKAVAGKVGEMGWAKLVARIPILGYYGTKKLFTRDEKKQEKIDEQKEKTLEKVDEAIDEAREKVGEWKADFMEEVNAYKARIGNDFIAFLADKLDKHKYGDLERLRVAFFEYDKKRERYHFRVGNELYIQDWLITVPNIGWLTDQISSTSNPLVGLILTSLRGRLLEEVEQLTDTERQQISKIKGRDKRLAALAKAIEKAQERFEEQALSDEQVKKKKLRERHGAARGSISSRESLFAEQFSTKTPTPNKGYPEKLYDVNVKQLEFLGQIADNTLNALRIAVLDGPVGARFRGSLSSRLKSGLVAERRDRIQGMWNSRKARRAVQAARAEIGTAISNTLNKSNTNQGVENAIASREGKFYSLLSDIKRRLQVDDNSAAKTLVNSFRAFLQSIAKSENRELAERIGKASGSPTPQEVTAFRDLLSKYSGVGGGRFDLSMLQRPGLFDVFYAIVVEEDHVFSELITEGETLSIIEDIDKLEKDRAGKYGMEATGIIGLLHRSRRRVSDKSTLLADTADQLGLLGDSSYERIDEALGADKLREFLATAGGKRHRSQLLSTLGYNVKGATPESIMNGNYSAVEKKLLNMVLFGTDNKARNTAMKQLLNRSNISPETLADLAIRTQAGLEEAAEARRQAAEARAAKAAKKTRKKKPKDTVVQNAIGGLYYFADGATIDDVGGIVDEETTVLGGKGVAGEAGSETIFPNKATERTKMLIFEGIKRAFGEDTALKVLKLLKPSKKTLKDLYKNHEGLEEKYTSQVQTPRRGSSKVSEYKRPYDTKTQRNILLNMLHVQEETYKKIASGIPFFGIEDFKDFLAGLQVTMSGAVDWTKETSKGFLSKIKSGASAGWRGIKSGAGYMWDKGSSLFSSVMGLGRKIGGIGLDIGKKGIGVLGDGAKWLGGKIADMHPIERLLTLGSTVLGGLQTAGSAILEGGKSALKTIGRGLSTAKEFLTRAKDPYTDVWVTDSNGKLDHVAIKGSDLAKNKETHQYFYQSGVGAQIYVTSAYGIEQPVYTYEDDKLVCVISEDDIKRGLYDSEGNKLTAYAGKSILGKMAYAPIALAGAAMRGARAVGRGIKSVIKKIGTGFSNAWNGLDVSGWFRDNVKLPEWMVTKQTLEEVIGQRLLNIYNLLDERLKGKKIRKGSYEDAQQQKKEREEAKRKQGATPATPDKEGKGGFWSRLFGSLFGGKNKSQEEDEDDGNGGFLSDLLMWTGINKLGDKVGGLFRKGKVKARRGASKAGGFLSGIFDKAKNQKAINKSIARHARKTGQAAAQNPNFFGRMMQNFSAGFTKGGKASTAKGVLAGGAKDMAKGVKGAVTPHTAKMSAWLSSNAGKLGNAVKNSRLTSMFVRGPWSLLGKAAGGALGMAGSALGSTLGLAGQALGLALRAVPVVGTILTAATVAYKLYDWATDSAPVKALRPARFKGYGLLNKHWEAIEDLETDTWDAMRSGQQGVDDDRLRMFGEKVGFITSGNSWGAIGKDFIGMGSDPDTDPIKNKIHFLRLWYKHRFLPVYATYISVFKAVSGDQDGSKKPWGDDLPDPSLAYEINKRVETNLGDVLKGDRLKLQLDAQHYATWLKGKIAYKNKKREENAAMDALHGASDRNLNTDYGAKTLLGGFKETGFTFKTAWNEMMHGNLLNALGLAIKGVGQLGATVITFPYKVAGAIAKGVWQGLKDLARGGSKNELAWDKVKAELYNLDNNDKNKVLIKDLETVTLSILDGERPPMDREEMEEWAAKFIPADDAGKILARANSAGYTANGSDGEEIRSVNTVHSESVNYIATWYKKLFVPIFTLYVNTIRTVAKMGPGDKPNPDDLPGDQREAVLQAFYREGLKMHSQVADLIPTTQAFTEWLVSSKEDRTKLIDAQKTLDADNGMDKWDRAINSRWSKAKQHLGDSWTKLKEGNLVGAASSLVHASWNTWGAIGNWAGKIGSSVWNGLVDLFGDTENEAQWKNRFEYYGVTPPIDKKAWLISKLEDLEDEQTKFIDNEIDRVNIKDIYSVMINTYNRELTVNEAINMRKANAPQELQEYAVFWYNQRFSPIFNIYAALVSRLTNRVPGDSIDVDGISPKVNVQAWNEFVKLAGPVDDKVKQFTISREGFENFLKAKEEHKEKLKSGQKGNELLEKSAKAIVDALDKRIDRLEKNVAFKSVGSDNRLDSAAFKAMNKNFASDVQKVEDMLNNPDPKKVAAMIGDELNAVASKLGIDMSALKGNKGWFSGVSGPEAQWMMSLAKAVRFPYKDIDANRGDTARAKALIKLRDSIYKLIFGANAADSDYLVEAQRDIAKFLHNEWSINNTEKYVEVLALTGSKDDVSKVPSELDTFVKHWILQVFTLGYTYWAMTLATACKEDPYNPPSTPSFGKIETGLRGKAYLNMFLTKIGSYMSGVDRTLDLTDPAKFKEWLDEQLHPKANQNIAKREQLKAMTAAQKRLRDKIARARGEDIKAAQGDVDIGDKDLQRPDAKTNAQQVNASMKNDVHGVTTRESERVVQQALKRDLKVDKVKVQVGGNATEKKVWDYLTKTMNLSPEQAAGIMGNIMQESGFNPTARNRASGAFGLLQWLGPRLRGSIPCDPNTGMPIRKLGKNDYWGLINFAKAMGKDPSDIEAQLAYMGWELTQNSYEKSKFQKVVGIPTYSEDPESTVAAVAQSWRRNIERCGEAEAHDARRAAYGIQYYKKFAGASATSTAAKDQTAAQAMEPVKNNGGQNYKGNDLEGYHGDVDKEMLSKEDYRGNFGTKEEARAYYRNSKSDFNTNSSAGFTDVKSLDAGNAKVVRPTDSDVITSQFGPRNIKGNRGGGSSNHKGIDLRARMGDPIYAMMDGTVVQAGGQYGTVMIDHGNGIVAKYLHNSKIRVGVGQKVKVGEVIALAGGRGPRGVDQFAPHCHLTILKNGKEIDPEMFLRKNGVELTVKGGGSAHLPPLSDADDEVQDKQAGSNDGEARTGETAPNSTDASSGETSSAPVQEAATSASTSANSSYVPASANTTSNPNVSADMSVPTSSSAGDATYQYTPVVNALKIIEAEVAAIKNKIGATSLPNQPQIPLKSGSTPIVNGQAVAPNSPEAIAQAVAQAVTQALQPLVQALANSSSGTAVPSPTPQNSKMDNGIYDVTK